MDINKEVVGSDVVVLKLEGRISLGRDCQQIEWTVDELLNAGQNKVILDLSEISHIDSSGIGILVMCSGKLKTARGELRLAGATGAVEQTLATTRLAGIVPIFATVAEAADGFAGAAA